MFSDSDLSVKGGGGIIIFYSELHICGELNAFGAGQFSRFEYTGLQFGPKCKVFFRRPLPHTPLNLSALLAV